MGLLVRPIRCALLLFSFFAPCLHPFWQSLTLSLVGLVLVLELELANVDCGCGVLLYFFLCRFNSALIYSAYTARVLPGSVCRLAPAQRAGS